MQTIKSIKPGPKPKKEDGRLLIEEEELLLKQNQNIQI